MKSFFHIFVKTCPSFLNLQLSNRTFGFLRHMLVRYPFWLFQYSVWLRELNLDQVGNQQRDVLYLKRTFYLYSKLYFYPIEITLQTYPVRLEQLRCREGLMFVGLQLHQGLSERQILFRFQQWYVQHWHHRQIQHQHHKYLIDIQRAFPFLHLPTVSPIQLQLWLSCRQGTQIRSQKFNYKFAKKKINLQISQLLIYYRLSIKMNQDQLRQVYEMVDNIPFSKPKKHINRDFSDGLMMAELIHYYNPKIVQLHNYPCSNSVNKKIQNWTTLNAKVFKKIGIYINKQQIQDIANSRPQVIQKVLYKVLIKFQRPEEQFKITNKQGNKPNFMNESQIQKSAFTNIQNRGFNIQNRSGNTINIKKQATDTQQILQIIDKIDDAYSKLLKLQEMNKLKQDMIRNLQKKVQKIIFN